MGLIYDTDLPQGPSRQARFLRVAVGLSLVFHFAIIALLPRHGAGEQEAMVELARLKSDDDKVVFYKEVDIPKDKSEPARPKAAASDLSRRAHGGEGQPDVRPGSRGNTPELRVVPSGVDRGRDVQTDHAAGPQRRADATDRGGAQSVPLPDHGAAAVLVAPRPAEAAGDPGAGLKGLPRFGGLAGVGGAVPDTPGGRVDVGPLSFDTQWYDWSAYASEMLRRIRYHWMIPEIAQLGVPGVVRIRFFIEREGRVTGLEIQKESEHPPMDFAARDAILLASPLPPLPADLTGVDREGVTITFYYNVRPPSETKTE